MPHAVGAGGRRLLRTPLVPLLGSGGGGLVRVDAGAGELLPRDSGRVRANHSQRSVIPALAFSHAIPLSSHF